MYITQNFYEPKTNLYDILIHFFSKITLKIILLKKMYMLIDQSILQGFNNYCKANTHSQSETKYDQLIKFATLKQLSTLKGRLLQLIQAVVSVVPQNQTY